MAKWQLLIRKTDRSDGLAKTGDIIVAVGEKHVFTEGELLGNYVLVVDGLDALEAKKLTSVYWENGISDPINEWDHAREKRAAKLIAKRKFQIPLEKMKEILPTFNETTAAEDAAYQPFKDANLTVAPKTDAMVYDKYKAAYTTSFTASTGVSEDG